jgi:formate hydrogenlyase transcriptional activator
VKGKVLGTFAVLYREVRNPDAIDLQLIENASHIAGIAIERHIDQQAFRHERDRLRLLLEVTNSTTSKLDLPGLVEALSTNLLSVTRCDFCALLLPDADSGQLRLTTLYNPEGRGSFRSGTIVPIIETYALLVWVYCAVTPFGRWKDASDQAEVLRYCGMR